MIKYEAKPTWVEIKKIEVDSETNSFVIINGRRNAKKSDYKSYFNTFEEAKSHILEYWENEIKSARNTLEYRQSRLGNAKGLKEN